MAKLGLLLTVVLLVGCATPFTKTESDFHAVLRTPGSTAWTLTSEGLPRFCVETELELSCAVLTPAILARLINESRQ